MPNRICAEPMKLIHKSIQPLICFALLFLFVWARLMCQDACPVSLPVKDRLQMPSQSLVLTPDYARCTECSAHAGSTVN